MPFPVKLAVPPLAGLTTSLIAAVYLWSELPIDGIVNHVSACDVPARKQLPTDITGGRVAQLDNALCSIAPLYRGIAANRMNLGAAALVLSVVIPTVLRQGYVAASPNNRSSSLMGASATVILQSIGGGLGYGFVFAGFGTLLLAMGLYQHLARRDETVPLVPTPAGSIYWINLSVVTFSLSAIAQGFFSIDGSQWQIAHIVFLTYPLVSAIFLVLGTGGVKVPANDAEARQELLKYSAEQVSYAFERTWSYYRKAALASMAFYWYGLHRLATSVLFQRSYPPELTPHARFLLVNFGLLGIFALLTILIERLTVRTLSSPVHPLTGRATPKLTLDCQKAISLAPAGNPTLERGTWQPFVAAIIGGPGLALALWWSGGEEEAGWLARRAWRETSAVQSQKKK